jgi:hypothetical protein
MEWLGRIPRRSRIRAAFAVALLIAAGASAVRSAPAVRADVRAADVQAIADAQVVAGVIGPGAHRSD